MSAGNNGTVSLAGEPHYPAMEVGEDIGEGDAVGMKAVSSRMVWVRALAAAGGTQVECLGFAPMSAKAGQMDKWSPQRFIRLALPATLPSELASVKPGTKLYLSPTNAGRLTKTKPSATGQLVQELGLAFWEGSRITGVAANENANGAQCYVTVPTVAA
jgi:hypothetical protein